MTILPAGQKWSNDIFGFKGKIDNDMCCSAIYEYVCFCEVTISINT